MYYNFVQDYLKSQKITDLSKFSLQDDGEGVYIKNWDYEVKKPNLPSEQEVSLRSLKNKKIECLKSNRDNALNNLIYSINIEGFGSCDFYLKTSDLAVIQARINSLSSDVATKTWGCSDGRRVELNKAAFQALLKHISVNDETVYNVYAEKLEEIEKITLDGQYFDDKQQPINSFQALENININFI